MKTSSTLIFLGLCIGMSFSALAKEAAAPSLAVSQTDYFHRTYSGKIGGKYPITMDLRKNGNELKGSYQYTGKAGFLVLQGTVDASGKFSLQETLDGKQTGLFSGQLIGDTLSGQWSLPDGSKKMEYQARKTAEFIRKSKKEALRAAQGDYYLDNISGAMGANGMFDIYKTESVWNSSISGISGGMRQGQEESLSREEVNILDSMRIHVDPTLTVRFFTGKKQLLEIPFNDTGMKYTISPATASALYGEFKSLSPSTIYVDDTLYLTLDNVNFSSDLAIGNVMASGILALSYLPDQKSFSVYIAETACCGGNVLAFKKK